MTPINIIFINMSIYKSLILKFITTLVFFNYANTININFHKGNYQYIYIGIKIQILTQDTISFLSSTQLLLYKSHNTKIFKIGFQFF